MIDLFRRKEYVVTIDASQPVSAVYAELRARLGLPALTAGVA